MFYSTDSRESLKLNILELKKELASAKDENQSFKVKIRKLQNEIRKRDRQIESLIDPCKSALVKKVLSEKGVAMLMHLRERNDKLEKMVVDKDNAVKRLQNDLQVKKLYAAKANDKKKCFPTKINDNKYDVIIPYYETQLDNREMSAIRKQSGLKCNSMCDMNGNDEKTFRRRNANCQSAKCESTRRSISADRASCDKEVNVSHFFLNNGFGSGTKTTPSASSQYESLSRDNLLSIIETLKSNQQRNSSHSDLDRCELQCDTPHQEIQQLQNYFTDMVAEVDRLKIKISSLKAEQDNTIAVLNDKDCNMVKLAEEIEDLKRSKMTRFGCCEPNGWIGTEANTETDANFNCACTEMGKFLPDEAIEFCTQGFSVQTAMTGNSTNVDFILENL